MGIAVALCVGSPSCKPAPADSPRVECSGATRVKINCQSEFKYDSVAFKGGFQALGVGTEVSSETRALRQIDAETERYAAQSRRLCEEYNACVIDKEVFATRAENLRRRMARVPELRDELAKAGDDSGRAAALARAYDEIVPAAGRSDLKIEFSVMAQRKGEAQPTAVKPGTSLPTGTQVSFAVRSSSQAYLYLFQRSPNGTISLLFPDARMSLGNPLPAGKTVQVPPEGSFRLNDKDIGEEKVFLVASLQPVARLNDAVGQLASGRTKVTAIDGVSTLTTTSGGCRVRALEYQEGTAPKCVRSRGLELDTGSAGAAVSMRVRTEAADSTVVTAFPFMHTK